MRKLVAALALSIATAHAGAASPTADSVEHLLILTKVESLMESMYDSIDQVMRQSMQQAAGRRQLTPEQQAIFDQLPAKFVAAMREDFAWAKMKPHYVRIYQESFEQEEIDGLITFYDSPTGKALVNKMPLVLQKSMSVGEEQMRGMMPKMKRVIDEAMKEAKITK